VKELIGQTAGQIWDALNQNSEMAVTKLPKTLNQKEPVVYQALGWLARENKINYRTKGKSTYVSITK
jgi:Mn-dependent DtxR family transcriptional regulator